MQPKIITQWQKVGTKRQSKTWNRIVPSKNTIYLLDCYRQNNVTKCHFFSPISHLDCTLNYSTRKLGVKTLNLSRRFDYVNFVNGFHNTKFQFSMAALSSYQAFCLALCTTTSGLVSQRRVTHANHHFFSCSSSNKNPALSCRFCKLKTPYFSRKIVGKLTVIQMSTVPHSSVQLSSIT